MESMDKEYITDTQSTEYLKKEVPQVAIVSANTLSAIGMRHIIERMMPNVIANIFSTFKELEEADEDHFFHYFISTEVLMENPSYFIERKHKTIVLIYNDEGLHFPKSLHTLNVCQPERVLVKAILQLAASFHGTRHKRLAKQAIEKKKKGVLTKRETQVLRLVVTGNINKEIAAQLGVNVSTVITHRKNIVKKLQIKSVSGLTIYAVTHGMVRAEEI